MSTPGIQFLEIDPTIKIGIDREGNVLHDGDRVLSFNLMADGETYPLRAPKVGVECTLRRCAPWMSPKGTVFNTIASVLPDGSFTGTNTSEHVVKIK